MQTAKATVTLSKDDNGVWMQVEVTGRKAAILLTPSNHGPLINEILAEWAESHFQGDANAYCRNP